MRSRSRRIPTHVLFPPKLARFARDRAAQLEIGISLYLRILLRNAIHGGRPEVVALPPDGAAGAQVRERIPVSLPASLEVEAVRYAKRLGGTVSRVIEALALEDMRSLEVSLTIWPGRDRPKLGGE